MCFDCLVDGCVSLSLSHPRVLLACLLACLLARGEGGRDLHICHVTEILRA